jgi:hypothetical protein
LTRQDGSRRPDGRRVPTFNTPLEAGLRALFILVASGRRALDLERLIYLDYAMMHSADFGGPPSIHPSTPSQGAQLLVRRALVQEGLELMRSRELVEHRYSASGIGYRATVVGGHVAGQFASAYSSQLRDRARWVANTMQDRSAAQLRDLFYAVMRPLASELLAEPPSGTAA